MSDESLFSKHWKVVSQNPAEWTSAERSAAQEIEKLNLPPLRLPERRPSWWQQFRLQIQMGTAAAVAIVAALVIWLPQYQDRGLTAKGSAQISLYWERGGTVRPLQSDTQLEDGDKVGASVIVSEKSVAYWAITDQAMKLVSQPSDISASRLELEPGVKRSFDSSFELIAPNQGEQLVIVVCPLSTSSQTAEPFGAHFDRDFVARIMSEQKLHASDCVYAGYRLRSLK